MNELLFHTIFNRCILLIACISTSLLANAATFTVIKTPDINDCIYNVDCSSLEVSAASKASSQDVGMKAGSLDSTFNNTGIVTTSFGENSESTVAASAIQPDGKIVVAGNIYISGVNHPVLVRYNKSGELDEVFGDNGKAFIKVAVYNYVRAIAVQPDGKIVAALNAANERLGGNEDFAVVRYNSNGSLDFNFGDNGAVSTSVSSYSDQPRDIIIQPDGKIVVIGQSNTQYSAVRYNSDGSLDSSFDGDGKVLTPILDVDDVAAAVLQPDGKILVTGSIMVVGGFFNFATIRYNSDGSLDTSLNQNGKVITSIGDKSTANDIFVQPDGKFLVVGSSIGDPSVGFGVDFTLVRYESNGLLDTTFGNNGKVITPVAPGLDRATSIALQKDGKIVVAGSSCNEIKCSFTVVRYKQDGSLDSTFGINGKAVTTPIGTFHPQNNSLIIQPDGKIVVAGSNISGNFNGARIDFAVVRYLANERTSFDFDGDGKADIAVFRPPDGYWYIWKSSGGYSFIKWGLANDILVPGDYDGDGRTDFAVYRPGDYVLGYSGIVDNTWYILRSSDNTSFIRQFGRTATYEGDEPLPADYDGDGKTDLATYLVTDVVESPSYFRILQSTTASTVERQWGLVSDRRVPADYDGDGKADLAVYRKGVWYILQSSDNKMRVEYFGLPTDKLVPADYDGDGKADIAVWRASNRTWYRINSSDKSFVATQFGLSEDKPTPADYDGDGKTDIAVYRPSTGVWYLQQSRDGFRAEQFGLSEDIPIPNVFVR